MCLTAQLYFRCHGSDIIFALICPKGNITCEANITGSADRFRRKANITKKNDLLSQVVFFGGRRWIRTTEVTDNRFTVCPLWPLGNSDLTMAVRYADDLIVLDGGEVVFSGSREDCLRQRVLETTFGLRRYLAESDGKTQIFFSAT